MARWKILLLGLISWLIGIFVVYFALRPVYVDTQVDILYVEYSTLIQVGDIDSIKYVLESLKWHPRLWLLIVCMLGLSYGLPSYVMARLEVSSQISNVLIFWFVAAVLDVAATSDELLRVIHNDPSYLLLVPLILATIFVFAKLGHQARNLELRRSNKALQPSAASGAG